MTNDFTLTKVCFKSFKILIKITIDSVQMLGPHFNLNICTEDREVQCGETIYISNLSRKRKKYKDLLK